MEFPSLRDPGDLQEKRIVVVRPPVHVREADRGDAGDGLPVASYGDDRVVSLDAFLPMGHTRILANEGGRIARVATMIRA